MLLVTFHPKAIYPLHLAAVSLYCRLANYTLLQLFTYEDMWGSFN